MALRSATFGRETALEIWQKSDAAEGADLLRALVAELDENISALGDGTRPPRSTGRSAWEQARRLGVSDSVHALLRDAYIEGGETNRRLALLDAEAVRPSAGGADAAIRTKDLSNDVQIAAAAARKAFIDARGGLLGEIDRISREPV